MVFIYLSNFISNFNYNTDYKVEKEDQKVL